MKRNFFRKKRSIAGKINRFLTFIIILLLVPLFFTVFYQKMQLDELFAGIPDRKQENVEKLVGILAKEIHADASLECLKAQAVIARTNEQAAEETGSKEPESLSAEQMQEVWGESFEQNYERMKQALEETAGETLQYGQNYIYAAYHAVSAGTTRTMSELYSDTDMPYLTAVDCSRDCSATNYLAILYWEKEEFLQECRKHFPEAEVTELSEIQILQKDSSGYVLNVQIGEKTYSGEEFRTALGLNSASFAIKETDADAVRIVTKGVGHGFGLSQYSAEKMAEEGEDYKNILNYFFPGTELVKE